MTSRISRPRRGTDPDTGARVVLVVLDGVRASYREHAARLGITRQAVYQRVAKAARRARSRKPRARRSEHDGTPPTG